jgi:magnesium transporter
MPLDRTKILIESIKRLERRGASTHLSKIVNKTHAADLSAAFRYLPLAFLHRLFAMIEDTEKKGILISELEDDIFLGFVDGLDLDQFVKILENMPSDDVTHIIDRLPDETADAVLDMMKKEDSDEVESLLRYDRETAGGIMVTDFIALRDDTTAKQAITSLQKEYSDVEMPFYLYAVDEFDRLVGVCSLRQLVVVPPEKPLKEFMTTDVYSVRTDMDQEDVARMVARYDILAVPVVDDANTLVGIITVDDVIDIIREEATEDILKMAGVGEEFVETKSVMRSSRMRLPWLFASCLGGVLAFLIVGFFESSIQKYAFLAAFIPVIMGMGGNVGTQSSTIVVRGLATGRINIRDIRTVVLKEIAVGLILGLVYGIIIAGVAQVSYHTLNLTIAVCLSVLSSMTMAALIGSMVPLVFARINVDPAVASGPFVTTAIDIISVFFYFKIAILLLEM